MNKKTWLMLGILIVAVATIASISAADVVEGDDNTIKVDGIEFNIPDGYTYDSAKSDELQKGYNSPDDKATVAVLMKGESFVWIVVGEDGSDSDYEGYKYDIIDSWTEKTISGKTGLVRTEAGTYCFAYVEGKKTILILTSEESIIDSLIK